MRNLKSLIFLHCNNAFSSWSLESPHMPFPVLKMGLSFFLCVASVNSDDGILWCLELLDFLGVPVGVLDRGCNKGNGGTWREWEKSLNDDFGMGPFFRVVILEGVVDWDLGTEGGAMECFVDGEDSAIKKDQILGGDFS